LIPDRYFSESGAADWLFNLCIAYDGDVGFVRDILSVYRINEHGQWSRLSIPQQQIILQNSYKKFLDYFPTKSSEINRFLIKDTREDRECCVGQMEECDRIYVCVDRLDCSYGHIALFGWLIHSDFHSEQHETKLVM